MKTESQLCKVLVLSTVGRC